MKKLIFTLAIFSLTLCQASTFIFENHMTQGYIEIQMMQAKKGPLSNQNSPACYFLRPYSGYLTIEAGDYLYFSDNDTSNLNFPLLDVVPLSGYVTGYSGAIFPIPPCNESLPNSTERYNLEYMKFVVKNGYDDGFGPCDLESNASGGINNDIYGGTASKIGSLPYLPGNPSYMIKYVKVFSYHYFILEDA